MKKKPTKDPIQAAAERVASPSDGVRKPNKRVVTLYLQEANYLRLQALHGRQVGKIIDDLIAAYLEAKGGLKEE